MYSLKTLQTYKANDQDSLNTEDIKKFQNAVRQQPYRLIFQL